MKNRAGSGPQNETQKRRLSVLKCVETTSLMQKKFKRETTQKHTTLYVDCAFFMALNVKKKKKNLTEMWCNNTTTSG